MIALDRVIESRHFGPTGAMVLSVPDSGETWGAIEGIVRDDTQTALGRRFRVVPKGEDHGYEVVVRGASRALPIREGHRVQCVFSVIDNGPGPIEAIHQPGGQSYLHRAIDPDVLGRAAGAALMPAAALFLADAIATLSLHWSVFVAIALVALVPSVFLFRRHVRFAPPTAERIAAQLPVLERLQAVRDERLRAEASRRERVGVRGRLAAEVRAADPKGAPMAARALATMEALDRTDRQVEERAAEIEAMLAARLRSRRLAEALPDDVSGPLTERLEALAALRRERDRLGDEAAAAAEIDSLLHSR